MKKWCKGMAGVFSWKNRIFYFGCKLVSDVNATLSIDGFLPGLMFVCA